MLIPQKLFATPPRLLDYLCIKQITVLIWAVSALTLISSLKGFQYRIPAYVKKVMFSGEVMPVRQLRLWQEALPKAEFSNLYGPTEITCNCTYFRIEKVFAEDEKIPIGRPFAGRKDFQVKIMGRRIELEEVEYILNQIQGVDKSCCVVDQKRKILMAYYCGAADQKMLRSQMRKRLPAYMIPKKIIRMEEIPLNKNGKTDRAQLLVNY